MALQIFDYSKIPTQKPWYDDIVGTLAQGFKAGQLPQQMARQRQQEELANSLKQLELEHKPKEMSLADALKQAQAGLYGAQANAANYNNTPEMRDLQKQVMMARIQKLLSPPAPKQTAYDIAREKMDAKRLEELEESGSHLREVGRDVQGIENILDENPKSSPTGIVKGALNKIGLGGKPQGELNEKALRLQADLTRLLSSRGGAVAANLAAQRKPNIWKNKEYNKGITSSMRERVQQAFKDLKDEYERKSGGKPFPLTLDDVFQAAAQQAAGSSQESKSMPSDNSDFDFSKFPVAGE